MATINGYTAEHMDEIKDNTINSASISAGNLIFTKYDGTTLNVGNVIGPTGPTGATGATGATGPAGANGTGLIVCTSTTRPASPTVGQNIYETNTGSHLVYYGATTGWQKPWNKPWGNVAEIVLGTNQTYANATWGFPVSWTGTNLIANRKYRATAHLTCVGNAPGQIQYSIAAANATPLRTFNMYASANTIPMVGSTSLDFTTTAGTMTRGLTTVMANGTGTLTVSVGTTLTIDDIGAATSTPPSP